MGSFYGCCEYGHEISSSVTEAKFIKRLAAAFSMYLFFPVCFREFVVCLLSVVFILMVAITD